jgi:hypothetical protein
LPDKKSFPSPSLLATLRLIARYIVDICEGSISLSVGQQIIEITDTMDSAKSHRDISEFSENPRSVTYDAKNIIRFAKFDLNLEVSEVLAS